MCRGILTAMRITYLFLILIYGYFSPIFGGNFKIKSLKTYNSYSQSSFPIINYAENSNLFITIEFDIKAVQQPNLNIVFRFCDKNWKPYNSLFLANQGKNIEYNLSFSILPSPIVGARYHYKGIFPNKNISFPFSGKWQYFITSAYDTTKIYASGKFIVVKPIVPLRITLQNRSLEGVISENNAFDRTFKIGTSFSIPDSLYSGWVENVEIITNQKIYYPIIIPKTYSNPNRYFVWNGTNDFKFIVKNIKPGNSYRQTDFRNINLFPPPVINAQLDKFDVSRFYKKGGKDLFGGGILTNSQNSYADYMTVNFALIAPENFKNGVFLVGAFTNWKVLPRFKMKDYDGLYKIGIILKRGEYDYQYVTGEIKNDNVVNINWLVLEGNFWSTRNEYRVFVFYKEPKKGGYDRIIGYGKIISGE